MDKKKILFLGKNFVAGGIERSYISFVANMKDSVEIDAFLCNNAGSLKYAMPSDITIYSGSYIIRNTNGADQALAEQGGIPQKPSFKAKIRNFIKAVVNKLHLLDALQSVGVAMTKKPNKFYDCPICFCAQNLSCAKIALKRVDAKSKWAVIHADVSKFDLGKKCIKTLAKFDKIICVSNSCAQIFAQKYPHLKDKTDYFYNFQNNEQIIEKSKEYTVQMPDSFNVLTVARLADDEKGIRRGAEVIKKLHDQGYNVKWHVVGSGGDEQLIKDHVKNIGATDYINFYGSKANPYPYFLGADLFLLCSFHESWGLVLAEAMTLKTPVLSTKTSSSNELVDGYGTVCENSADGIYNALKDILDGKIDIKAQKDKLENYLYDNQKIKERILSLLEEK